MKRLVNTTVMIVVVFLFMSPCSWADQINVVKPETVGMSGKVLAGIDEYAEVGLKARFFKGAVVLVARHGQICYFKAYGDASGDKPMKKNAIFRQASMTKPLVMVALMQFYDKGRFKNNSWLNVLETFSSIVPEENITLWRYEEFRGIMPDLLSGLTGLDNVNQLMQMTIEMARKAFVSGETGDDYVLSGQTNLMSVAEMCDVEKLKKLFESFNQKRDILHLLEQSIHATGVQIFIGEESGYEVLDDCSIVTSPYEVDGQIFGVLGVIGPTRMHYDRVIPIVDITAKMLGSALNSRN